MCIPAPVIASRVVPNSVGHGLNQYRSVVSQSYSTRSLCSCIHCQCIITIYTYSMHAIAWCTGHYAVSAVLQCTSSSSSSSSDSCSSSSSSCVRCSSSIKSCSSYESSCNALAVLFSCESDAQSDTLISATSEGLQLEQLL
jgi:hypothetical protein